MLCVYIELEIIMSEKVDFKQVQIKLPCYIKLVRVQSDLTSKLPSRPSLSDVIEKCLDAYLEGQK